MPISSLLHRLGKFPLVNIFKRQIKSRLSFHPFHGTYWRKTKLHEDVFGGDHPLSGSSEVHYGGEVPPQDYELVISYLELLLDRSIFSTKPWPDSTNEVESLVLTAAAEGRWEAIQQAFDQPGQGGVVREARNKYGWTSLHFAAHNGHLHLVKKLIKVCGMNPDQQSKHHWTPLFTAAWAGREDVVLFLLREHECSWDIRDVDGRSLLHAAVHSGNMKLVQWFIKRHHPAPTVTKDGGTLLIPAAESGNTLLFDWLVKRYQLVPNQWSENGLQHPLLSAATYGHLQLTQHLIQKYSCDVYCKDKVEETLLHYTAVGGSVELFEWLIANYKLDVEAKTEVGGTPLMLAAAYGHLPLARLLVEMYHCDVNEEDLDSWTPVMYATQWDRPHILKMLVEYGADVCRKAQDSSTALHYAAYHGSLDCVEYLLPLFEERKLEEDEDGRTCLHYAVAGGSLPVMRYLVDQCGFDLGSRTGSGRTSLMLAAACGHLPLAQLLVETYHCDVNEEDGESWTPVMWAAWWDQPHVVKMLVEHGGEVLHKAQDSSTALHWAARSGSLDCVEYLLPLFGERKLEEDEYGWTCLHYAVAGDSLPVMRYLVDQCGFDLSLRDEGGQDCFLLACWYGHEGIVRELLTKDKVDQNVVDKDGHGAVHLACKGGHAHLAKTLVDEFGMSTDIRDNDGRTPIQLAPDSALADLLTALNLEKDSSAPQSHESVLEDVCWVPLGIQSLHVTPDGGVFPLVPEAGEEEEDKSVIQLHVPQGAVRAAGEGMIEIRYAVIADGPFRTPEGYSLCSMAVYIHYNPAWTTKPFRHLLPHWSGAPDHPTFVTSPHTLPEGEQYYPFRLLEGGEFGEGYGIVKVDGHCTLFGQAYRLKDTSVYYALLLEREEGNSRHSRVAITFADVVWIQILNRYWKKWKKCYNVPFQFVDDLIEGNLDVERGRGWDASIVGPNRVSSKDVAFKTLYRPRALKIAVIEEVYPPSITVKAIQSNVPEQLRCSRLVRLHISRTTSDPLTAPGGLTFPFEVIEEKELCAGEMEVVQSRPEDPLSQPVHLCERHAVLFRKHISRQAAGKGKAILECVGLTRQEIKFCYQNNPFNEEEAIQDGLDKWRETHGDHCTWQVLLEAMKFAGIAQQHCSELVEELQQRMQGH